MVLSQALRAGPAAPKMVFTRLVILTQTTRFSCLICWHLRVALSSHLDAVRLRIAEDLFGSIQFLEGLRLSRSLSAPAARLSHVDLVREVPFRDGEMEESNIKRMHFSC